MILLSILMLLSAFSFSFLKINLKRRHYEQQQKRTESSTVETDNIEEIKQAQNNEPIELETYKEGGGKYSNLVEEGKQQQEEIGYL